MHTLCRAIGLLFIFMLSSAAMAAEIEAQRSTIETEFLAAAKGKATTLGCIVAPQNTAFEICSFQAGEAVAISFLFDAKTKDFRATSVFFAEKEADLAIEMGRTALKTSKYAAGGSVDFPALMQQATLTGKEVQLSKGVAATARKTPPSLYVLVFGPTDR